MTRSWRDLVKTLPAPGLLLGTPISEAVKPLEALAADLSLLGGPITNHDAAQACLAALWLRFDHFDRSHAISQELETPDGSYWHGIAHRREGDYSNACYWFRRVGAHPVFAAIAAQLPDGGRFAPADFTRRVEQGTHVPGLLLIQELEWKTLFEDCRTRALKP